MVKPPLVPRLSRVPVPRVKGSGRRAEYSTATRTGLVDVAEQLFTDQGYAGTSLDQIVSGAEVTKGALYHHFRGKSDLFDAVFERVEERSSTSVAEAIGSADDPWDQATAGLRAFLEVARHPSYRRIVILDGPAVLGYERFREQEDRSTFASVRHIVESVLSSGGWDLDEDLRLTFTQIFFGAMSTAGATIANAADPAAEAARVESAIGLILEGLRTLAESGRPYPGAEA